MCWKIYFWISALIAGVNVNVIVFVVELLEWQVSGFASMLISWVHVLAVYAYIYKKQIFSQGNWKVWLVIVLILHVLQLSSVWSPDAVWDTLVITIIVLANTLPLPAWYCLYRLGFSKSEQVNVAVAKISKNKSAKRSR